MHAPMHRSIWWSEVKSAKLGALHQEALDDMMHVEGPDFTGHRRDV